jgi:hypothetical protein
MLFRLELWSFAVSRFLGIGLGLAVALAASACASKPNSDSGLNRAVHKTGQGLDDAALTPLNDFNLRRVPIPARLEALASPYEPLPARTCAAVAFEVTELTKILGADSDAPPPPRETIGQRAGDGAAELALGGVASAATDFIPFRSVVREATGASAHERRLRAAYERGVARRSYLKGIGASLGCAPPAAPEPGAGVLPAPPPIEYRGQVQPS